MSKAVDQFIQFDTAFQNTSAGEMYVPRSDGQPGLVPTGFCFEQVTQGQPKVTDMEGPRNLIVRVTPWAFATRHTAEMVREKLLPLVPGDVKLSIEPGDKNTQFPFSHDQLYICAKRGQHKARINAGLLASNIARTTATVDGEVKQFPKQHLEDAVVELVHELDRLENPQD